LLPATSRTRRVTCTNYSECPQWVVSGPSAGCLKRVESEHWAFYAVTMLKAGVFDEFRGARTLLLWGDQAGMTGLLSGLTGLRDGKRTELTVEGIGQALLVRVNAVQRGSSTLERSESSMIWECSSDVLDLACDLTGPLLSSAGHQVLDVDGLAKQIIIARDEYPAEFC
jgi:hypothetical protein